MITKVILLGPGESAAWLASRMDVMDEGPWFGLGLALRPDGHIMPKFSDMRRRLIMVGMTAFHQMTMTGPDKPLDYVSPGAVMYNITQDQANDLLTFVNITNLLVQDGPLVIFNMMEPSMGAAVAKFISRHLGLEVPDTDDEINYYVYNELANELLRFKIQCQDSANKQSQA